jgi:hypothetical protein
VRGLTVIHDHGGGASADAQHVVGQALWGGVGGTILSPSDLRGSEQAQPVYHWTCFTLVLLTNDRCIIVSGSGDAPNDRRPERQKEPAKMERAQHPTDSLTKAGQ